MSAEAATERLEVFLETSYATAGTPIEIGSVKVSHVKKCSDGCAVAFTAKLGAIVHPLSKPRPFTIIGVARLDSYGTIISPIELVEARWDDLTHEKLEDSDWLISNLKLIK